MRTGDERSKCNEGTNLPDASSELLLFTTNFEVENEDERESA